MKVPLANLPAQYAALKAEMDTALLSALADGAFVLGTTPAANERVEKLERDVAAFCGAKHGIAVNSGTDALLLSLMALNIGPGDEVITTPFTFVATVETVALLGATPVFADIDPATFNLAADKIADKITPQTKAILPVHLFGQMADMTAISEVARAHNIPIIGDAAQAIGCAHSGELVAKWSLLTTLSFYPTKNLGAAGDAGMILTDDDELNVKLRALRFHGSSGSYRYKYVGICSRLDGLQAALLNVKLPHLAGWNEARRQNAAYYAQTLAGHRRNRPPGNPPRKRSYFPPVHHSRRERQAGFAPRPPDRKRRLVRDFLPRSAPFRASLFALRRQTRRLPRSGTRLS